MEENPGHDLDLAARAVIASDSDYEEELKSLVTSSARDRVLKELDAKHPELCISARATNYLRDHTQLAKSTARRETIAEAGLQELTLSPKYHYQAAGPNKRYNLLYTPSRVNLGENERDSVAKWRQWVGGADQTAAQAGFNFYSLINEGGVEERPALAHAEIQKTSENALCVTHFAGSNALGLLINAVLEGDVEDMADQMNLRGDRYIPPAGEGYGGYCVPKDGLFLAFVLSLTNDVKLRQMGVPEHLHEGVMKLAKEAFLKQKDFATTFEWEDWTARQLMRVQNLREYFDVSDDGLLVFHVTKIAKTIERLGKPWQEIAPPSVIASNMAAKWGVEHMIINAEQVNRFMTFYKAWLIYQALAEARKENPNVAEDNEAIVALTAEYKPVQDVRFSTGLRLFEMLAGTDAHLMHSLDEQGQNIAHLLLRGFDPDTDDPIGKRAVQAAIDLIGDDDSTPEAIESLKQTFPPHDTPADLIMTSVTLSSTKDMLFYTSDTRMDQIADRVKVKLGDFGLTEEQITANCQAFGGNLRRWAGLRNLPEDTLDRAVLDIGGEIHALVLKLRGPGRNYETDVQGVDVLNTGIPFPELLELIDDTPKLVSLMLMGNPNSALAITDGTSGRQRRCFTFRDVQNFFAACEVVGRRGVYRAIGLGQNNVDRLREEMHQRRDRSKRLYSALRDVVDAKTANAQKTSIENAHTVYAQIVDRMLAADEPGKALREEERLKRYKKWRPGDALISQAYARIQTGLPLELLDTATWVAAFGGQFALTNVAPIEVDAMLETISKGVSKIRKAKEGVRPSFAGRPATRQEIQDTVKHLVRPKFMPEVQQFSQEMLVESSSKAVEVAAIEALERRQALRARAARAQAFSQREKGFIAAFDPQQKKATKSYADAAKKELDVIQKVTTAQLESDSAIDPSEIEKCHTAFGRFVAFTRNYLVGLAKDTYASGSDEDLARLADFENHAAISFTGREIILEDWKLLAGGYEDLGDIARLGERLKRTQEGLEDLALGVEFFYIALGLAQTLEFAVQTKEDADLRLFWKRTMDFFAETINDHFYPYTPWAFSRGVGYTEYNGEELYDLCNKHHTWLYNYLYNVVVHRTDYGEYPEDERDSLIGNFTGHNAVIPIGGDGDGPKEKRWRAYNQLRELVFMRGDGFLAPVVFPEFDPDIIESDKRVNLVYVYPVGRTHISRAFREGPTLNNELKKDGEPGLNLIVTRRAELCEIPDAKRECLVIHDGHLYLSEKEYIRGLVKCKGMSKEEALLEASRQKEIGTLTKKGIRAAVRFVKNGTPKPVICASVFPFHGLTIYEQGKLEELGLPATVQSMIFTDITYDKSIYPEIYDKKSGVQLPAEIDWKQQYSKGKSEDAILKDILDGIKGTEYPGLKKFSRECPILLIKGAAESGARNLKVFDVSGGNTEELDAAAEFIYEVGKKQSVVIQEAILTSPEFWASNDLMEQFVDRQVLEWNRPVSRSAYPRSQIYGSLRIVTSSSGPKGDYDTAFPIALVSLQVATNVGRGGTLEPLLETYIQEEHKDAILAGLNAEVPKVMKALARYAETYKDDFAKLHGWSVGKDLRGVSYSWPSYMMLDYLVAPVFKRQGKLVDIEPTYDDEGNRIGSRVILEDKKGRFEGEVASWRFIHLEPNIGIGLWDRYNLREEELEQQRSDSEGKAFNWDNVGRSDRVILRNFAISGREYLDANFKK